MNKTFVQMLEALRYDIELTYVASVGEQEDSIEMRYEDENIWLTQKMMSMLYDVALPTINEHIKKIYADSELEESATIRKFRIVQTEGNRQVQRETIAQNYLSEDELHQLNRMVNLFIDSLLVYSYKCTKSVIPGGMIHGLTGAVPSVYIRYVISDEVLSGNSDIGVQLVGMLPAVLIGIIFYCLLYQMTKKMKNGNLTFENM